MSHYIDAADITEKLVRAFIDRDDNLEVYMNRMDAAVVSLCLRKGLSSVDSLSVDDDGHVTDETVADWCRSWVCREVCFDNVGANNLDIPKEDKYLVKYMLYKARLASLDAEITKAVLADEVDEANDYTGTSYGLRS